MKKILSLAAFAVLAGYASQGQPASQPEGISYKEASAFETALLDREINAPKAPEPLMAERSGQVIVEGSPF